MADGRRSKPCRLWRKSLIDARMMHCTTILGVLSPLHTIMLSRATDMNDPSTIYSPLVTLSLAFAQIPHTPIN